MKCGLTKAHSFHLLFSEFTTQWGFTHITSSPTCPHSNGKVHGGHCEINAEADPHHMDWEMKTNHQSPTTIQEYSI